jgi:hypothetical protein
MFAIMSAEEYVLNFLSLLNNSSLQAAVFQMPALNNTNNSAAIYLNQMNTIKNYFKRHPYVLVTLVIAFIWITISPIESDKYLELLKNEGLYTLATIDNIKGARSGRWVIVKFNYNGTLYETEERNETIPLSWIGEKVFIKFLPSKPEVADILEDAYVSDSLAKEPDAVWKDLPYSEKPKVSILNSRQRVCPIRWWLDVKLST